MFEVKKSEGLRVKIYDNEYSLSKPTVKMIEAYAVDIADVPTSEKFARAKTLLVGMGLDAAVIDGMEFDHLNDLIEFLTSSMQKASKKN
jgi:hypothetical protein